jgi:hypothetical protein
VIDTDCPGVAVVAESATVGFGGNNGNPEYSKSALPAPTGVKLLRSIIAKAHPSRPELNSSCVGGQEAFGSSAWKVGTVQVVLKTPEAFEMAVAADARSISFSAASSDMSPASEAT